MKEEALPGAASSPLTGRRSYPTLVPSRAVRVARSRFGRAFRVALLGWLTGAACAAAQTFVSWGALPAPTHLGPVIYAVGGAHHFLLLQQDGTVAVWGLASCGVVSAPEGLADVVAIAAGEDHNLAVKADGTVVAWGCGGWWELDEVPAQATNIVQVAAGGRHSLALRSDGSVIAWGDNTHGQCSVPENLHSAVGLAAGSAFSLALEADGTVAAWGDNAFGQSSPPEGLEGVVAVAAGNYHALALRADGTVVAWGSNRSGQCEVPAGLAGVSAISAHANASLALKTDGQVVGWGEGVVAQPPPDLTNVVGIAAGGDSGLAQVGTGAPYLVRPTRNRVASPGSTVTLSAGVQGTAPMALAWYKDGQPLTDGARVSGVSTPALVIQDVRAEDSGWYSLQAVNAAGTLTAPPAELAISAVPRIELEPRARSQPLDSELVLSVSAAGTEPLSYRWFRNGLALADSDGVTGATRAQLEIRALTYADAGAYSVVVSNAHGSATSRSAQVSVGQTDGWGESRCGELDFPPGLDDVVAIAAGDLHVLALRRDGTVVAWGDNFQGQCEVPEGLDDAAGIAAGGAHSLAVRRNGTVVGWGYTKQGHLEVPPGLDGVTAVAAGTSHSLALRTDGTVVCWGFKRSLNAEVAAELREVVAVAAGGRASLALRANGTVVIWGAADALEPPPRLKDVVAVAAGRLHALALKTDGTVVGWGRKGAAAARVPEGLSNVVQIAAGAHFSLALKGDGTVVAWGNNKAGESTPPRGLQNVVAIGAGHNYAAVLKGEGRPFVVSSPVGRKVALGGPLILEATANGTAPLTYQWFKDGRPVEDGAGIAGAHASSLSITRATYDDEGTYHLMVVNSVGSTTTAPCRIGVSQVLGWGEDALGQADAPAAIRGVVAVAGGDSHAVALHADGSLSAWGEGGTGQTDVPPGPAVAVAAGRFHNLALRPDGTVVAWGRNRSGQCEVPAGLSNVIAIAAGGAHSLALRAEGTVVGWGRTLLPPGLPRAAGIAAGGSHSLALLANGEVAAWGHNGSSQCVVPRGLGNVVSVAAGRFHSLALRSDGTVVAWGLNNSGQCDVPPDLGRVVAIAAGGYHSSALRADGAIVTWGLNSVGQCDPAPGHVKGRAIAGGRTHTMTVVADGRPEFVQPVLVEAIAAGAVRLSGLPLGEAPLTFQWFRDGQPLQDGEDILGATTGTLTLQPAAARPGRYFVRVTNGLGSVESRPTELSAALAPRVQQEVSSLEALQHSRVRLGPLTEGAEPIAFGWFKDDVPLADEAGVTGATSPALAIEELEPGHAGSYRLSATNVHGSALSPALDLSVSNVRGWGDHRRAQSFWPHAQRGIKAISALADHGLALHEDGTVLAWGNNSRKQCNVPPDLTRAVSVAAGEAHSMALDADGTVLVWGDRVQDPHVVPADVTNIVAIAAGPAVCYALRGDGQILRWSPGSSNAQFARLDALASGPITGGVLRSLLAQPDYLSIAPRVWGQILDLVPGTTYHHAITLEGRVTVWGRGSRILSDFLPLGDVVAMAAGIDKPCIALTANGTVLTWLAGTSEGADPIEAATGAVAVAVGRDFYLALTDRGHVDGWGSMVLPPANLHDVVGLSAGGQHSLAVRAEGRVVAWGDNRRGECTVPPGLSNVLAVAAGFPVYAGGSHSLALREDGLVVAWGENRLGQTAVPPDLSGVVAIAAGEGHSLALEAGGTIVAWGNNSLGQSTVPADLPPATAIAAGASHSVALIRDGTVVCWGARSAGQCQVPDGLTDVVGIAAGRAHTVALRRDGTVALWGDPRAGLSDVATWSNIVAIAAGGANTVGLKGDGAVVVAGDNAAGQLEVPPELRRVDAIAMGDGHVLAAVGEGPLVRALDVPDLDWRTGGQRPWRAQMQTTRDGRMAAQSGPVLPGQESWLETTLRGPGILTFWWRTASTHEADALELTRDGTAIARVTGNTDWEAGRLALRSGWSRVRWRYVRASEAPDAGLTAWLDRVTFDPAPRPTLAVGVTEGSSVSIRFETVEGLVYALQSVSVIEGEAPEWITVTTIVGAGQPAHFSTPLTDTPSAYFRVVVE